MYAYVLCVCLCLFIVYYTSYRIRGANLDSAGWRMVRSLHRAAACGDASVVHALLTMGALPNEMDVNK